MPEIVANLDSAEDDVSVADGTIFNGESLLVGFYSQKGSSAAYSSAVRFASISVPPGAIITSATLNVAPTTSFPFSTPIGTLVGSAVANQDAWTAQNIIFGDHTANSVPVFNVATQYDVTEIVTEILEQPGWATGNAMGFVFLGDPEAAGIAIMSYEQDPFATSLIIQYTGDEEPPTPTRGTCVFCIIVG